MVNDITIDLATTRHNNLVEINLILKQKEDSNG
jgi:hypothetical protein